MAGGDIGLYDSCTSRPEINWNIRVVSDGDYALGLQSNVGVLQRGHGQFFVGSVCVKEFS